MYVVELVSFVAECLLSILVGKTLAFTSIRFTNEKNELVARGNHTKYAWYLIVSGYGLTKQVRCIGFQGSKQYPAGVGIEYIEAPVER